MDEEEASVMYWTAVERLREVIVSGHRGSKVDILEELNNDLVGE